jgi:N-acetylneuraminate synthase
VDYVCSPFSLRAAQRQAPLVDRWKIASGQVTNIPMLEFIASTGKPVIVSMGLATQDEERAAMAILGGQARLMACSSLYPCPPECGLPRLDTYECSDCGADRHLGAPGLSDHTEGVAACLGAVALGATVIEKHVTLSRHLYGSDARWAMEPEEFRQLVLEVRALEAMLKPRDEAEYRKRVAETRQAFMHGGER